MGFHYSKTLAGNFEIYEAVCGQLDSQLLSLPEPVAGADVATVNFVVAGSFDFGGRYTFRIGCQTYDYPDRFAQPGEVTLTALEAGSTLVCINPVPHGSHFNHAQRYLQAGETLTVPQGHLLYLGSGSLTANGRALSGPRALLAQSGPIGIVAVSDCIAAELWK